jgi:RNA polymerase sigma factor for flagellar operon FliA
MEELPETRSLSAEARYLRLEVSEKLRGALSRLPTKNRQVLESYYFEEKTLESIGARLGLSKSWVSRLHAKSLDLLREAMVEAGVSKAVSG